MGAGYSRAEEYDDDDEEESDVEDQRRKKHHHHQKKKEKVNTEVRHPASIKAPPPSPPVPSTIEVDSTTLRQGFVVVTSWLDLTLWTLASSIILFGLFLLVQASVEGLGAGWVVLILFGYLFGLLLVFRVILPVPLRWAEAHMHAILARGELESSLFWSFVHRKLLAISTPAQQPPQPQLIESKRSPTPPPPAAPASPTRSVQRARRQTVYDDDNSDSAGP